MKREQKSAVIDELAEDLGAAEAIFAVDYKGISVPQAAELRSKLRESDAQFKVVKNRLAKLAAEKAGTKDIDDLLQGPIALTLIKGDAVVAAKTITTFTKEHDVLEYRGGVMDGAPLDVDSFQAIAQPPRPRRPARPARRPRGQPAYRPRRGHVQHDLRPRPPARADRRAGPRHGRGTRAAKPRSRSQRLKKPR